ncbi:putative peptidoglycan glycosyltransferase FtsW [Bacillus bombysepticus]|uniref:FtsW/RodA/SpoVE family cell cycle protein n=1 Tax=Bacillus bombysepticus TaxID=658666 RepID=UPI00301B0857
MLQKVKMDPLYTAILVMVIGIGLSVGYSAGSAEGIMKGVGINYFLKKQIFFMVLGVVTAFLVASLHYRKILTRFIWWINGINVLLLLMSYVPAFQVVGGGAGRWVNLMGLQFQPSELTKIIVIVTMAYLVNNARNKDTLNNWRSWKEGLIPISAYLGLNLGLVFLQKHLSATALIVGVSFVILFMGGLKKRIFGVLLGAGVVAGIFAIMLEPYRMKRIVGFVDPEANLKGEGWQIVQGWYGLGSGGFNGLGLGMSRQKFGWIPEHHTDYIVGVIGEEIGFIGLALIIVLFLSMLFRGYILAMQIEDFYGKAIVVGIQSLIFMQFALNLMVVSGLFPPTGVPVPFISYGGSSTVVLYLAVGLIYNVYSAHRIEKKE